MAAGQHPASSLYGGDAFLGIINIRTRRGGDIRGVEVSGDAGTFSSFNGRLIYGDRFSNGLGVTASMSRYGSHGDSRLFFPEFDSPETNNGIAMNADAERATRFYGSLSYRGVEVAGGLVRRNKTIPTAAYDTIFNTDQTFTDDDRSFVSAKVDHNFASRFRVMGRVYFDAYRYFGQYFWDGSDGAEGDEPVLIHNRDSATSNTLGAEWQVSKVLNRQTVVAGGEFRNHYRMNQSGGDLYPGPGQFFDEYLNIQTKSRNWAAFAQDELTLSQDVTLTAGIRYDSYSWFGGRASPRLALVYRPRSSTAIKAMYGGAFRPPSTYELDYGDGVSLNGNPDLKPETIRSLEFSVQHSFGPSVQARLGLYRQTPEHLIRSVTSPVAGLFTFENIDTVTQYGVEWELDGLADSGLRGQVSYAFQRTTDAYSEGVVANSPEHLVKFAGTVPLISDVSLSLEGRYVSSRETIFAVTTPGHFVMNATLFSRVLRPGLELSGSLYNILNSEINDPAGWEHVQDFIRQDGRTGRLKLTYKF
jgi:outer membrane receptor for ferrienterochelin and colicins